MRVWLALFIFSLLGCSDASTPVQDADPVDQSRDGDVREDAPSDAGLPDTDSQMDSWPDATPDVVPDAAPRLGPPYPIVLAHGFFGFDEFAGLDFETYFFEVKQDLLDAGETQVFTPTVDPFNNSALRGLQLDARIEAILEQTGHDKVIIVGHSQGGLDARVVAREHPERVAAIVTISTPHDGTPLADIVIGLTQDERLASVIDAMTRAVAAPLYDDVGDETSVMASFRQLSTEGARAFNAMTPDVPNVPIFSIAGRSDRHFGGNDCRADNRPDFIQDWDLVVDPIDPLFAVSEEILDGGLLAPYPNDGLVRVRDAKRGRFLGCIPADHMDQIGQILGDLPGLLNRFRHKAFFRSLVSFLRREGF